MKLSGGLRYWRCPDCGELHDKYAWPGNHRLPDEELCAPMIINDNMPHIQGQHDGKWYDSKRALRASYQPSGNRDGNQYTEVGNDPAIFRKKPKAKADRKGIKAALGKAFSRVGLGA